MDKQRVKTDYRGGIFASLYKTIKTKCAISFNRASGQNQCHSTKVNKNKHLINMIASYYGYRQKMALMILSHSLSYPQSRDAIASKN